MRRMKRNTCILMHVIAFLVHVIGAVTGLLEFSKSIQDLYTIRTVQCVSIATCRLECESRQRCKSAIYYRQADHYILTLKDGLTNTTVVSKGVVLFSVFNSSLDQEGTYSNCGGQTCLPHETCTTKTHEHSLHQVCEIIECPNPRGLLQNGTTVKGNIYTVGSKIIVGCDQYGKTIQCGSNGNWTTVGSSIVLDLTDMCGSSEVYTIYQQHQAYRDMDTDQGDWLVFQRKNRRIRTVLSQLSGFGDKQGEYWLGLEVVYEIIQNGDYELRIDMENFHGEKRFAKYSTFSIGDETSKYTLNVSGYSGDAGDALSFESGNRFSTFDEDNDASILSQCALRYKGAWWYKKYSQSYANPNGVYINGGGSDQDTTHMHWPP